MRGTETRVRIRLPARQPPRSLSVVLAFLDSDGLGVQKARDAAR
jgi:hypothetical protein